MAGAGVMAGIGFAALAPAAAIGLATTFGTASTGVAIASLAGAAEAGAALAWLGGGTLAVGGGGIAAGEAMLALAGPIGWGIGLLGLGGAAWYKSKKNAEHAEEANRRAIEVDARTKALQAASAEIDGIHQLTAKHGSATLNDISRLHRDAPSDYRSFSHDQKEGLATFKNNIETLCTLLAWTAAK